MKNASSLIAVALVIGGLLGFAVGQANFNYQYQAPTFAPATTAARITTANPATMEALWSIGGQEYQDQVKALAVGYESVMDKDCRAPAGFDVSPAVKAYGGFVAAAERPALTVAVRTQVAALACIGAHGENYAYSVL